MNRTRAEIKAELLAKMEAELDSLLDWAESNSRPTLVEIEEAILRRRQEIGQAMVQSVINAQDSVQLAPGPQCPVCGKEMRLKGRKGKHVETRLGPTQTRRCYYYCPHCQRGFFPPR
jgi:hypothetical protein